MPGESKLSVAGLPPGLTVGALLAAAALAVVAQLVCHRCGGMGAHATQPLAQRAHDWTAIVPRSTIVEIGRGGELMCCGTPRGQSTAAPRVCAFSVCVGRFTRRIPGRTDKNSLPVFRWPGLPGNFLIT